MPAPSEISCRRESLSFSLHAEVSGITDKARQDEILDRAESEGLKRRDILVLPLMVTEVSACDGMSSQRYARARIVTFVPDKGMNARPAPCLLIPAGRSPAQVGSGCRHVSRTPPDVGRCCPGASTRKLLESKRTAARRATRRGGKRAPDDPRSPQPRSRNEPVANEVSDPPPGRISATNTLHRAVSARVRQGN